MTTTELMGLLHERAAFVRVTEDGLLRVTPANVLDDALRGLVRERKAELIAQVQAIEAVCRETWQAIGSLQESKAFDLNHPRLEVYSDAIGLAAVAGDLGAVESLCEQLLGMACTLWDEAPAVVRDEGRLCVSCGVVGPTVFAGEGKCQDCRTEANCREGARCIFCQQGKPGCEMSKPLGGDWIPTSAHGHRPARLSRSQGHNAAYAAPVPRERLLAWAEANGWPEWSRRVALPAWDASAEFQAREVEVAFPGGEKRWRSFAARCRIQFL